MKKFLILLVLVLVVLGVSGCTQSSPGSVVPKTTATISKPTVPLQETIATLRPTPIPLPSAEGTATVSDNTVLIKSGGFDPQDITVKTGATVRWQNVDNSAHRLSFVDGYKTQTLAAGQSASEVFNNPGVFDYTDMMNPSLQGTVNVV